MDDMKQVEIFTDGACSGNPGPGGYGVILRYGNREKELSGGERETTNNRMELMAAITGLEALKESCRVTLYSDSKYLIDALKLGWAAKWRANGWMRKPSATRWSLCGSRVTRDIRKTNAATALRLPKPKNTSKINKNSGGLLFIDFSYAVCV